MNALLGGLSKAAFLRTYWQKRPLLVRQAIPGFAGILSAKELCALSARADATSRLVAEHPGKRRGRWEMHTGPFHELTPESLPRSHWTLAVQGVEGLWPGGWELLRQFSFLPAARIDDLMITYAAAHGSVGPHDDVYDVFLLQGPGRRRWQINRSGDRALDPHAPLKILRHFEAEQEFILEAGDMLYLPPGVAHWGVALEPCFTYSIGFVAPSHEALLQNFIAYLGQRIEPLIDPGAMYQDPPLKPQRDPFELGGEMIGSVESLLDRIKWDRSQVEEFLGRLLTGPKPHVAFEPPARPLSTPAFARRFSGRGRLQLALPSRGLLGKHNVFINGAMLPVDAKTREVFQALLTERHAPLPLRLSERSLAMFYRLYRAGHVTLSIAAKAAATGR